MAEHSQNNEDDVRAAQRGRHAAFVRLIKTEEQAMYRIAKAYLKSDAECADAMQETVLKAYKTIRSLREPAYFRTWLLRILINECKRILQYKSKVVTMETEAIDAASESKSKETEAMDLGEALQSLDEELRVVVSLYYLDDRPLKEVAGLLELPEGTVKSRLYRAREKLARFLRPERSVTTNATNE
ncbi:sigma-70 family RNA polymerase sigma factor [Paenibacillus sp. NPDC058071]|uniref:sigma-70 family RNA polymerase sigma factor n=1 Tax=Paenibacillus sp. NPDC058071 TaxID=3346326 RepID=UPI0036DD5797